jgi:4-hydroxybenzoate polyprenyltransferase
MSERAIGVREFVVSTVAAVVIGVVFSAGAVYGLNRIFDAFDQRPNAYLSGPAVVVAE